MLPETIVCQQPCSLVEMTAHIQAALGLTVCADSLAVWWQHTFNAAIGLTVCADSLAVWRQHTFNAAVGPTVCGDSLAVWWQA